MKTLQILMLAFMLGFFVSCDEKSGESTDNKDTVENNEEKPAAAEAYTMNAESAEIMWMGTKAEGAHYGSFGLKSGSLMATADGIESGSATIDLTAIQVLDDTPDEGKGQLIGHLTSEDFFNTAAHPEVGIEITGSEKYSGAGETAPEGLPEAFAAYHVSAPTHNIMAKLTVKGETNDITFPAMISMGEGGIDAAAFITFDRRDYGLRFMSDTEANVNPDIHVGLKVSAAK